MVLFLFLCVYVFVRVCLRVIVCVGALLPNTLFEYDSDDVGISLHLCVCVRVCVCVCICVCVFVGAVKDPAREYDL